MTEGRSDRDFPERGDCDEILKTVAPDRGDNEGAQTWWEQQGSRGKSEVQGPPSWESTSSEGW